MYNYRITATVFGASVQWDTVANTTAEAVNLFHRSARQVDVELVPDSNQEDGTKAWRVVSSIGGVEHESIVRSVEIYQPTYERIGEVTRIQELGPVDPG